MSKKRTVCMVTDWYPTKENPYVGSFFKEQALALREHFDFLVVHYKEKGTVPDPLYWLHCCRNTQIRVDKVSQERNLTEYTITAEKPLSIGILCKLCKLIAKLRRKPYTVPAVYRKHRKKQLHNGFVKALGASFDLLYCVSAQAESGLLQEIAGVANKPYVVAEHAPFPWPGTTLKQESRDAIAQADAFLAISWDKVRQVMMQDVHPRKICYVGNLVNEKQFALGSGSGGAKTFVMVAAHSFYKNYPLFIEIFNRLTQITDEPFKVMVVGYNANKGYSKDADVLEQKLKSSAFASSIELIPAISRDQIQTVYGRADAFVMTSVQEGMPVSALEAGCCGLPIFSTMCGGVEDYVDDSIGRIFKIVDSEAFAQTLKDYLEGKLKFDSQHIRQHIVSKFGHKAFTENIAAIFNNVIDQF